MRYRNTLESDRYINGSLMGTPSDLLFVGFSLEVWYFMALILFAGYLKNPQVSVAALSIW